jgi:NTP pyrophosphatase (non-canonical NTP hydrolase)
MAHMLEQLEMVSKIITFFQTKRYVWPDGQDAATFCAQESMELVDCFLREKTYVRNHEKPIDGRGKEAAQVLMMLLVTCDIAGIDLEQEFLKLVGEV